MPLFPNPSYITHALSSCSLRGAHCVWSAKTDFICFYSSYSKVTLRVVVCQTFCCDHKYHLCPAPQLNYRVTAHPVRFTSRLSKFGRQNCMYRPSTYHSNVQSHSLIEFRTPLAIFSTNVRNGMSFPLKASGLTMMPYRYRTCCTPIMERSCASYWSINCFIIGTSESMISSSSKNSERLSHNNLSSELNHMTELFWLPLARVVNVRTFEECGTDSSKRAFPLTPSFIPTREDGQNDFQRHACSCT